MCAVYKHLNSIIINIIIINLIIINIIIIIIWPETAPADATERLHLSSYHGGAGGGPAPPTGPCGMRRIARLLLLVKVMLSCLDLLDMVTGENDWGLDETKASYGEVTCVTGTELPRCGWDERGYKESPRPTTSDGKGFLKKRLIKKEDVRLVLYPGKVVYDGGEVVRVRNGTKEQVVIALYLAAGFRLRRRGGRKRAGWAIFAWTDQLPEEVYNDCAGEVTWGEEREVERQLCAYIKRHFPGAVIGFCYEGHTVFGVVLRKRLDHFFIPERSTKLEEGWFTDRAMMKQVRDAVERWPFFLGLAELEKYVDTKGQGDCCSRMPAFTMDKWCEGFSDRLELVGEEPEKEETEDLTEEASMDEEAHGLERGEEEEVESKERLRLWDGELEGKESERAVGVEPSDAAMERKGGKKRRMQGHKRHGRRGGRADEQARHAHKPGVAHEVQAAEHSPHKGQSARRGGRRQDGAKDCQDRLPQGSRPLRKREWQHLRGASGRAGPCAV